MAIPTNSDILEISLLDIFKNASKTDVDLWIQGSLVKTLKHRQYLYTAGDNADRFFILMTGAAKLIRPTQRGDDHIVHFASKGDVIGALLMTKGPQARYPISVRSLGTTRVLAIPRSTYEHSWVSNAVLQNRLNSHLYQRMTNLQDKTSLMRSPLQVRIAHLLVNLLEDGTEEESGIINIPLTRQEIADALGVAVESVIRIMSDWTQSGYIRSEGRQIELVDVSRILQLSSEENNTVS